MEPCEIGVDISVGNDETSYAVFRVLMDKLTLIYWNRIPNDQKRKISIENTKKFIKKKD